MISLLFALLTSPAFAESFGAWSNNELGISLLTKNDKLGAYKAFTRALEHDPLNGPIQYNLGRTFEANEEWDKAASTYESVIELNRGHEGEVEASIAGWNKIKFRARRDANLSDLALFNLGNVLAAQKKIPAALAAYQKALDHAPNQAEGAPRTSPKDIKKNIELLFAKGGGQGDGKGQSDEKNPDKDKKDQDKDKDKKDDKTNQQKREESLEKPQPDQKKGEKEEKKAKPFESQELSQDDVKRILDEIKNQEQGIRAHENEKKPKDGARGGKDW